MNGGKSTVPRTRSSVIRRLLDAPRTPDNRSELSECGLGYLREYAKHRGWSGAELGRFLHDSLTIALETDATPDRAGLEVYLQEPRGGRGMLISSRAARVAAFAQLVGRDRV